MYTVSPIFLSSGGGRLRDPKSVLEMTLMCISSINDFHKEKWACCRL